MAERKHTPDVLADILGAPAPGPLPAETPTSVSNPRRAQSPAPTKKTPQPEPTPRWEYRIVSFQEYHGWRPRYENGSEIVGWMRGPVLHDFINEAGADGWELAAATAGESLYGVSDGRQLYFKRLAR